METMLKNLKTAIFKVMETMFFLLPDEDRIWGNTVYIGITGEPEYLITFGFHSELAKKMTVDLLGAEEGALSEELVQKCLKETANIIAGNFLHSFQMEENRNLTLPSSRKDDVFGPHKTREEHEFTISFEGQDVAVRIEVIERSA